MPEQIIAYTAKICPWAHRVELTLEESGLDYTRYEIDLKNKPEWYAPKVNPASKVPAIAYGGPKVAPDDPSPESVKIAESYVLIEFLADLAPHLLPEDPVQRAKARFFIETAGAKLLPTVNAVISRGEDPEVFLKGIETIQALLPAEGFAVGEWSIADAAITPFLARAEVSLENEIGAYDLGLGKKTYDTLHTDPRFSRFHKYFEDIKARRSFKETFDAEYIKSAYSIRFKDSRAQKAAGL